MQIVDRLHMFTCLFEILQETNSRIEKEQAVQVFRKTCPECVDDLNYILETLDGKHPIGWTFVVRQGVEGIHKWTSIKEMIMACESIPNRSQIETLKIERAIGLYGTFLEPIVNRTLRLGIGRSLLSKSDITPMLAKKYEGGMLRTDVIVTEKLDGNRCVAFFDGERWQYRSRSGKVMNVDFDMTGMDTNLIYDGEIMSEAQTLLSDKRYRSIVDDERFDETVDMQKSQLLFNETSGLINRHGQKSGLVYNIFDIVSTEAYLKRREKLNDCEFRGADVRLLPILYAGSDINYINCLLDKVTGMGGEGVMLNLYNRGYEHKRTDALLKYKQVQFVDMKVIGFTDGTGKYVGCVGALECYIKLENGNEIYCEVGTGLSDAQREEWAACPSLIIGKIVQVGYHEMTQNRDDLGSNRYSLRFPRLVKVRNDKTETSEY